MLYWHLRNLEKRIPILENFPTLFTSMRMILVMASWAVMHPELVKQFDAIQKKEHQQAHIKEWEFIDPKFNVKNNND